MGFKVDFFSAIGDPSSHKTWSGTPKNILNELSRKGKLGIAHTAKPFNLGFKIAEIIVKVYYKIAFHKKDHNISALRFKTLRLLNGYYADKAISSSPNSHLIHFGTLSLPLPRDFNRDNKHYVIIDGAWSLWSRYTSSTEKINESDQNEILKLEKKSLDCVKHIFSISQYVKDELINFHKILPSKITVIGTGTGIIKPFYGQKDYSKQKLLFVAKGRFSDKGGALVLESFEKAVKNNPNLELSIVGQENYEELNLHPNIKTYGYVSIQELQELFNSHTLFIMPAINEPWGLVYIEAMLCKMPVIGLERNSIPELTNNGLIGYMLKDQDADTLAKLINQILSEPDKIKEMGEEAQHFVLKNFTWDVTTDKILEKISELEVAASTVKP